MALDDGARAAVVTRVRAAVLTVLVCIVAAPGCATVRLFGDDGDAALSGEQESMRTLSEKIASPPWPEPTSESVLGNLASILLSGVEEMTRKADAPSRVTVEQAARRYVAEKIAAADAPSGGEAVAAVFADFDGVLADADALSQPPAAGFGTNFLIMTWRYSNKLYLI